MFLRFFKDTLKETGVCVSIVITAEMLKTQALRLESIAKNLKKNNHGMFKDGRLSPGPKDGRASPGPSV
jgi:hypothetical protein